MNGTGLARVRNPIARRDMSAASAACSVVFCFHWFGLWFAGLVTPPAWLFGFTVLSCRFYRRKLKRAGCIALIRPPPSRSKVSMQFVCRIAP